MILLIETTICLFFVAPRLLVFLFCDNHLVFFQRRVYLVISLLRLPPAFRVDRIYVVSFGEISRTRSTV